MINQYDYNMVHCEHQFSIHVYTMITQNIGTDRSEQTV